MALLVVVGAGGLAGRALLNPPAAPPEAAPVAQNRAGTVGAPAATASHSLVMVGHDRALSVVGRVSFRLPQTHLTFSVPARTGPAGDFEPRVTSLQVRSQGSTQTAPTERLRGGGTVTINIASTRSVTIQYSATGVVLPSEQSSPGRALALVTPMFIEPATIVRTIEIEAPRVLNVGCVAPDASMTICGKSTGERWAVEVSDPRSDVVAQVDLAP